MISCRKEITMEKDKENIQKLLIRAGADINLVTSQGQTALSQAIANGNNLLTEYLLKLGAKVFNEDLKHRDSSAIFQAINKDNLFAIEILCDYDADLTIENSNGYTPLLYSAKIGRDKICMYLTLRSKEVDYEDKDGKTVFLYYLERSDIGHCK